MRVAGFSPVSRLVMQEFEVFADAQAPGQLVHVAAEVGQDGQTIATTAQFFQNRAGLFELHKFLGHRYRHVPDLLGHAEGHRDARFLEDDLLVASEELAAGSGVPLAEGPAVVFLVEIEVGDGVTASQPVGGYANTQVLTGGMLDLRQRRPETHQGVVEIEKDSLNHLRRAQDGSSVSPGDPMLRCAMIAQQRGATGALPGRHTGLTGRGARIAAYSVTNSTSAAETSPGDESRHVAHVLASGGPTYTPTPPADLTAPKASSSVASSPM